MFEDKASKPIGTGPYVLKNFQKIQPPHLLRMINLKLKMENTKLIML